MARNGSMMTRGSLLKVEAGEPIALTMVGASTSPLPSEPSIGPAARDGSSLSSFVAFTMPSTSVCTAFGLAFAKAPDTSTTVPGWFANISLPVATIFSFGSRPIDTVTAGSRKVAPSTAPASTACCVASIPIVAIS